MTDTVIANVGEQTANNESKSAKKNAAKRSTISSVNVNILSFILRSTPYECDAIRVVIKAMSDAREMEQLSSSETTLLNHYMNEGLVKDDNHSLRTVRKHRQKMAGQLLTPLSDFLEQKGDVAAASALLSDFANDDTLVEEALAAVQQDANKSADKSATGENKTVYNSADNSATSDSKPADKLATGANKSADKSATSDSKSVDMSATGVGKFADKSATSNSKPADNVRQGDKQGNSKPHANAQQAGSLFVNQR